MYNGNNISVIIAAAGRGTRMGSDVPKQYLKIDGEPIIVKTLRAFDSMGEIDSIIAVVGEGYVDYFADIVRRYKISKVKDIAEGGRERQDSIYEALKVVASQYPETDFVLVHDGARPFVNRETVLNVINTAAETGAAVACVPMKDSLRKKSNDKSFSVDREDFFAVQTPQGFKLDYIIKAYDKAYRDGFYGTDDAVLLERAGYDVAVVNGDYGNIKITTREDIPMENRVGTGFDVHAFAENRKLILGGVEIPYERGLAGHSDADVLVHALMDALLGAAALGDIGRHFPDTDSRYKGISSMILLQQVDQLIKENGYTVINVDVTVIAQAPKISSYIDKMVQNIADVLNLDKNRINIKGTTTERLGFTGRKEGIAAEAACSICR